MRIPRLQLFELEDLPWFPKTIRDFATDYLEFIEARLALHVPVVPLLAELLAETKESRVIDLCSGGGGPVASLSKALHASGVDAQFTLTDRFPNVAAFSRLAQEQGLHYTSDSVDATAVPPNLTGVRTIFNAFHHFGPASAKRVLGDAVHAGQPIGIFEIPERSLRLMITLLFAPVYIFLATPLIRPLRWQRFLWTYLIPLVTITCWWDGIVSVLRAYTVPELLALSQEFSSYTWQAGRIPAQGRIGNLTYLMGAPTSAKSVR